MPIMLFSMAVLKILTYYGQYYAHVKRFVLKNLAVLLEYIHLHLM